MVVAILAAVLACCGASYAAFALPANSVGTLQLRDGAVTPAKMSQRAQAASASSLSGYSINDVVASGAAKWVMVGSDFDVRLSCANGARGGPTIAIYPFQSVAWDSAWIEGPIGGGVAGPSLETGAIANPKRAADVMDGAPDARDSGQMIVNVLGTHRVWSMNFVAGEIPAAPGNPTTFCFVNATVTRASHPGAATL
jgi:hypothetical protein